MFFKNKPARPCYLVISLMIIWFLSGCSNIKTPEYHSHSDLSFNLDWRFVRDSLVGAEIPDFNDSGWRIVDLPHDWSIEDLPGPDTENQIGPFTKDSPGITSTGYVKGGTGWYRKHFTLDASQSGKIVKIYFDGVYYESDVWVNGQHAGYHAYGYTPFYYDITNFLSPVGEPNVIAVRVHNTGQNSRWYSGSGIYRDVKLLVLDPVHIDTWSVYITTPRVSIEFATVQIELGVKNTSSTDTKAVIRSRIVDHEGEVVGLAENELVLTTGSLTELTHEIEVLNPALWSVESPNLYKAVIEIEINKKVADTHIANIGIRSVDYSAEKGLLINGKNILLKGGCMHHDNGILGSAAFNRAESRKVELMKANGLNAIRTAHNPPSQAFLDACDRIGMLVIDESFDMWTRPKKPQDYSLFFNEWWEKDMEAMILRDRNHPSVIIWSIGNEIPERGDTSGYRIAGQLIEVVRRIDPTRPVTNALCRFWDNPDLEWEATIPAFEILDMGGYNYRWQRYESDHEAFPERIMMGTESVPKEAFENWELVKKHPYVIGDFVWTGMDYFGETGIGHSVYLSPGEEGVGAMPFPWFNAWCGDIDICGDKKPQSYYRDIVWDNSRLCILVHAPVPKGKIERVSFWGWPDEEMNWNWPGQEGELMKVSVYSSCDSVRLTLNNHIIGTRPITPESKLSAFFEVPYEPGELKVIAFENGIAVESRSLITTGPAARLILKVEDTHVHADRNDLAYFRIIITDEVGRVIPDAEIPVKLTVWGEGELQAAGSANPNHMESLQDNALTTFRGRGLVIIRPTLKSGEITLEAQAEGLKPASVTIHTH